MRRSICALGLLLCGLLTGCGQDDIGPTVPVEGKVVFGDRPLTTGVVVFNPDASRGNKSPQVPRGVIDDQGNYKLLTHRREGAAPGWYRVAVVATKELAGSRPKSAPGGMPAAPESLIPVKYADAAASGIGIEVVAAPAPGAYDLRLVQ